MTRYLVTGGAGFIGSNFIHYMLKNKEQIQIINVDALTYAGNLENLAAIQDDPRYLFIQADICVQTAMSEVFEKNEIDCVVNFAAESHVDRSIEDPNVFARSNVMGTLNLLNTAMKQWKQNDGFRKGVKFLQVSTDEVYGSLGDEGYFSETSPLDPHSPYSASKTSADLFVKAYADTYRLPVNITRCSNNYGPYQFPEKLIPLIINNALSSRQIPVYGDGMNIRDWLYVEDHCRAIDMVIDGGTPGEIYNIGGHNERTNLHIVKTILALLKEKVNPGISEQLISYVGDRKGHDRRYAIDAAKINRDLGWKPLILFEQGIGITIDWYLNNRSWMENVVNGDYKEYYSRMYGGR